MTRSWKDYPSSFFTIIDRFEKDKTPLVIDHPHVGELRARRRLFYLFFKSVAKAVEENDRDALNVYRITRNLTVGISPSRGDGQQPGKLTIRYDLFASAMEEPERVNIPLPEQNPLLPKVEPQKETQNVTRNSGDILDADEIRRAFEARQRARKGQ